MDAASIAIVCTAERELRHHRFSLYPGPPNPFLVIRALPFLRYQKCQLGFTPALKDMDICVADQYDGADDYRLFYLGEQLKRIESEKLYFPELSHA